MISRLLKKRAIAGVLIRNPYLLTKQNSYNENDNSKKTLPKR